MLFWCIGVKSEGFHKKHKKEKFHQKKKVTEISPYGLISVCISGLTARNAKKKKKKKK